jgi:aryl-alcohol dehydrogenase-like predicted oxidoreductase
MQRRDWLTGAAALAACGLAGSPARAAGTPLLRTLPRSGIALPAIGMGTWLTFNVAASDRAALQRRGQVLQRFFAGGGRLIDSSPMYGSAEEALGTLLPAVAATRPLFAATKVWTPLAAYGRTQVQRSLALWGLPRFDLLQCHNLLNWDGHQPTLRALQAEGRARLLGVTTSHGNKHGAMQEVLAGVSDRQPLDTLQITYSPADRRAEPLLQLAADRGLGVIVNRPFDGGHLLQRLDALPLPPVATDLGCSTWAALVLKWILAHPAVTVAIPATTDPLHMDQNMAALHGPLPDRAQRAALTRHFDQLLG